MTNTVINYTITSKDSNCYNVIQTNLQPPLTQMCKLTLTGLTTKACFDLIDRHDYIEIDDRMYFFNDEYSDVNPVSFSEILNTLLGESFEASVNNTGCLQLRCNEPFIINSMTYNIKLISGFYDQVFPTKLTNELIAPSVGLVLSTPVLYVVSNLGAKCYDNKSNTYCDRKVLMRINNSFTANYPIICNNFEFSSYIPVNSLSNIEFRLVDANLHNLKLLCPMYLSATVEAVESMDEMTMLNEGRNDG